MRSDDFSRCVTGYTKQRELFEIQWFHTERHFSSPGQIGSKGRDF